MVKTRMLVCVVVVLAVSLGLNSEPINAQGDPAIVVIKLHYRQNPDPGWEIKLLDNKGPDVCRNSGIYGFCDGDEITWMVKVVPGNVVIPDGSTLTITPVDSAPRCFTWQQPDNPMQQPDNPMNRVITWPNTEVSSGPIHAPAHESCEPEKHGHLWAYEIEFHRMNSQGVLEFKTRTDPRGILH